MKPQQPTLSAANYIFLWEHLYTVDKLQALVYDTTGYAIGLQKLSSNRQFVVGVQIAVSFLQTTQSVS